MDFFFHILAQYDVVQAMLMVLLVLWYGALWCTGRVMVVMEMGYGATWCW